jgi:hypothetical protein
MAVLLGLDGCVLCAQLLDDASSEWWLAGETTEDRAWCPSCGVRAVGHCAGGWWSVICRWRIGRWCWCGSSACGVAPSRCARRAWSEESDQIAPGAVLTERARAEIARRVGPTKHSVAQAARHFGVSWHAAMAAVRDHGRPSVDHVARLGAPAAVGLDETSFLAATAERPTLLVTGITHLDTGRLVDVLPSRSAVPVSEWLWAKPKP